MLRENKEVAPKKVRIEIPLPNVAIGGDELVYNGLHGQGSDWSGGIEQRWRVTKKILEKKMFDGYDYTFEGLLDRDADGMAIWTVGQNMSFVTHPRTRRLHFF